MEGREDGGTESWLEGRKDGGRNEPPPPADAAQRGAEPPWSAGWVPTLPFAAFSHSDQFLQDEAGWAWGRSDQGDHPNHRTWPWGGR